MDRFGKLVARSFKSYRTHWIANIAIVFLVNIMIGGYSLSSTSVFKTVRQEDTITNTAISRIEDHIDEHTPVSRDTLDNLDSQTNRAITTFERATGQSNAGTVSELVTGIREFTGNADKPDFLQSTEYSKGVIATLINKTTQSGSIVFGILQGVNTLIFKDRIANSVVIFLATLALFFITIFVKNIFTVGMCRYFSEHRLYRDTKADRILFVYRYGKTLNVAKVMFLRSMFQVFWAFTIVGGIIKYYEYSMIPYILAENPTTSYKDAFRLSKEMTKGYKKRMFLYDIVIVPAYLLSSFSYNILSVLFLDPMKTCFYTEIFTDLRKGLLDSDAKAKKILWDRGLDLEDMRNASYPDPLFPIAPAAHRNWLKYDYERDYTFSSIVLLFFTYSFVGWIWEIFYTLFDKGIISNRGTLNGPWLPIYGCGGLLIIMILKPLRRHPVMMFLGAVVLCGGLEYFTSWILEQLFHSKWWDYTGMFMNLNGRICLEGLIIFGVAGLMFTYIFSPILDNIFRRIKPNLRTFLCAGLLAIFILDVMFSVSNPNRGAGITEEDTPTQVTSAATLESDAG
ncbi:MAG: hypothetical protein J6X33_08040 [Clostridiales bacterium]|nr:hypothetical protein [Clostridiales bacterium]